MREIQGKIRSIRQFHYWVILVLLSAGSLSTLIPGRSLELSGIGIRAKDMLPTELPSWTYVRPESDSESRQELSNGPNDTEVAAFRNRDGNSLVLTLEYGSDFRRRTELHIPEYCHRVRGDRVEVLSPLQIRLDQKKELSAQLMEWSNSDRQLQTLCAYWFVVGTRSTSALSQLKLWQLWAGILGRPEPALLVRIDSFQQEGRNMISRSDQVNMIQSFLKEVFQYSDQKQELFFFGEFQH